MSRIAEKLGITRGAVAMWSQVPAERLLDIEEVTGIDRRLLRPDLFENMPDGARSQPEQASAA